MPSGPGVIPEATIAAIARRVPPSIGTFLLTSATSADIIVAQQRGCGTNTIQLCDYVDDAVYHDLRRELPGIALVQVVHVNGPDAVEIARAAARHVDALLLDSGNTALPVKELGGTGRTHDWATSRLIRDTIGVPVFLAGGLNADNVAQAIGAVEPFGVDLCSGIRTRGLLDPVKLDAFFAAMP
jgi:phosphoribosylanthranilate isomerase